MNKESYARAYTVRISETKKDVKIQEPPYGERSTI